VKKTIRFENGEVDEDLLVEVQGYGRMRAGDVPPRTMAWDPTRPGGAHGLCLHYRVDVDPPGPIPFGEPAHLCAAGARRGLATDYTVCSTADTKTLVERALFEAAGCALLLDADGEQIASVTLAKSAVAVVRAGATGGDARLLAEFSGCEAKDARQAFQAWAGPRAADGGATSAVMASLSAAGAFHVGHHPEARRLADNALRFAGAAKRGTT
jgi:hypothetical protein